MDIGAGSSEWGWGGGVVRGALCMKEHKVLKGFRSNFVYFFLPTYYTGSLTSAHPLMLLGVQVQQALLLLSES